MGLNKRYFDMEKLAMYYEENPKNGITQCVGKTDAFFFDKNDEAKSVIELWSKNKIKEANLIIEKYIKRRNKKCI